MKNQVLILVLFLGVFLSPYSPPSCDKLIEEAVTIAEGGETTGGLTESEIVQGLKTALRVGTDSSVTATSRLNGFYRDEAIKILLPPEASVIYEHKDHPLVRALGIDQKIEDAVLALNRAAEDASKKAGPIFKEAITGMSIQDGLSILRGKNPAGPSSSQFDSTAATAYLKVKTKSQLRAEFEPVVNQSLDQKLIGNYSPNEVWNTLTSNYNQVARRSLGAIEPIDNTDLGAYVTGEALDGLFYKVAEEEKKIRKDPYAWARTAAGNILKRVFGRE